MPTKTQDLKIHNLRVWDSVQKTDPDFTKPLQQFGGKFTTVQTMYNCRRATELWGPVGEGWGTTVDSTNVIEGQPIDDAGTKSKLFIVCLSVWWRDGTECHDGLKQYGSAFILKKDKRGIVFDDEAPKKAMTDALGKCLSYFGFSADIYLGMWDDNKYIATVKHEKEVEKKKEFEELITDFGKRAKAATTSAELNEVWKESAFVRKESEATIIKTLEELMFKRNEQLKLGEKLARQKDNKSNAGKAVVHE